MAPVPYNRLPVELYLKIIRLAASPLPADFSAIPRSYYSTAIALCSVSHAIRRAAMPHLLRTVVLNSSPAVRSFIKSILLQRSLLQTSSRLALDYTPLIHHFWSTMCLEPLANDPEEDYLNYNVLYDILRNLHSLGLDVRSQHLLYNGLASSYAHPTSDWRCHHLTLCGRFWKWSPFTSTPEGQAFLRKITHLVIWLEDKACDEDSPFPDWLKIVPFSLMPNLTHFAFPLCGPSSSSSSWSDHEDVKRWLSNKNLRARGYVENLIIKVVDPRHCEMEYLQNEEIFLAPDTIRLTLALRRNVPLSLC